MNNFIKALYADLIHRIDVVIADIKRMPHHPDIKDRFIVHTLDQFVYIRDELQAIWNTGVLEIDFIAKNNISRFNGLHRSFKEIHSYRYLVIKNYKDPEIFFYQIMKQIYAEHRIHALPPIVSTISNHEQYYWAVPSYEIIALPSGEEQSLLNLPDIYHEIGHLLHRMFAKKSCELSADLIDKYFENELNNLSHSALKETITQSKYRWQASWLEEFSCDLMGAYMTGAAYAWTNLKLLSTHHGSVRIFESYQSHPADEARMRIIILMLEKLGLTTEKEKVEAAWSSFLIDTAAFIPEHYPMLFPLELLQHIVDEFYTFYQSADLVSCPELAERGIDSIGQLLTNAWHHAQTDPETYSAYETESVNHLRAKFGLTDIFTD